MGKRLGKVIFRSRIFGLQKDVLGNGSFSKDQIMKEQDSKGSK